MRAVRKHANCQWVVLYVERWLKAPVQLADGTLVNPGKGTPQGGVISPLLANLFLHYGFDMWVRRKHPSIPWERYADDVVCHCQSEDQAKELWRELKGRFSECGLSYIRRRPGLSTARMMAGEGTTPTRVSTSLATLSGPGGRRIGGGNTSSTSVRR